MTKHSQPTRGIKTTLFAIVFLLMSTNTEAITLQEIGNRLTVAPCQSAYVKYEVWLPSSNQPVTYSISLLEVNPGDTLSASDYLLEWQLPRGEKVSKGFSSYHAGDHFRYRDTRLQEYHFSGDPIPFSAKGGGVQRTAQFVDLLPAYISEKISEIQHDSTYNYSFDQKNGTLTGVRSMNGYDALDFTYRFDPKSGLPQQIDFVFNPASISEQTVTATYTWNNITEQNCPVIDEAFLISKFPDEFGKFRTSNFRVENLRGNDIPAFSYTTLTGERFSHSRGEADIKLPVVIAFIDPGSASSDSTIESLRRAVASVPMSASVLYAFAQGNTPESFIPAQNESVLNGAPGFIAKCGIAAYPTILLVSTDGIVRDVIIGTSEDFETSLSQTLMLLN